MNVRPARGFFSRARDLGQFNERFPELPLERVIGERAAGGRPVRILEVGCGEGRVLMQLRKLFPDIELVGINRAPWQAMTGQRSLLDTALHYGIFQAPELASVALPDIVFCDATSLDFPDGHFDVIYSQVAVPYIQRKDLFLAEAWRTLKPGGLALLHVDSDDPEGPAFMRFEAPRFLVCRGKTVVPLSAVIEGVRRTGLDITCYRARGRDSNLVLRKNTPEPLSLDILYVPAYSFDLRALMPDSREPDQHFWGFRSFYEAGPSLVPTAAAGPPTA